MIALTLKWFRGKHIYRKIYIHIQTERKIKQMWQNVNIWQIWRSSESSRYSSYNSSVVIFFQIKVLKNVHLQRATATHISLRERSHTLGNGTQGSFSFSKSLRIVVLSFSLLLGRFSSVQFSHSVVSNSSQPTL